jgi:indolepyruvate ferredoxin oxidoreductase alpha subunit
MKQLMTGDEAVARGAYEAGVHFAAAYPGTPSTEILENLAQYDEIYAEWSVNEKVAMEAAAGAALAGARSIVSMKHVGLNVAADPMFTLAYIDLNAPIVIVTADEPGQFSSQNEQDNRNYAKAAKLPMFEPSDSAECRDMLLEAYNLGEAMKMPVLFRMTTRVCHSKSVVELGQRTEVPYKEFVKAPERYVCVPANSRGWKRTLLRKFAKLREYSHSTPLNYVQYGGDGKVGVIASGISFVYAKEVFGNTVSYLKLGFTNPLPDKLISAFCSKMETVYVIEENDPYIEDEVRRLGFDCRGKDLFPEFGEMLPDVIRKAVFGAEPETLPMDNCAAVRRAPTLCAGCPHRGFFIELGKHKDVLFTGDIGCYSLAYTEPYRALDSAICMGASLSMAHGAQIAFDRSGSGRRVIGILGDSTFFHTGINSLINTLYNNSRAISVILDNRITGMTGHQQNPCTGYTAKGEPTNIIDIEAVVRGLGIRHVKVIDPNNLKLVRDTINEFLRLEEPSVIITRWPCVLKKLSAADKEEFKDVFTDKYRVNHDLCIGCKLCLKTGCPSLRFDRDTGKVSVESAGCVGCGVCAQVCPKQAIQKEGR